MPRYSLKVKALAIFLVLSAFACLMIITGIALSVLIRSDIVIDPKYGWDDRPYINHTFIETDSDGSLRNVNLITYAKGYRRPPQVDTGSDDIRILVIGDSFTFAGQVSNGEEYYSYIEKIPGVKIFPKGVDGWGTMQEYLFLKDNIAEVKPDIILLQFCDNDFINNNYYLDRHSVVHNSGISRPYLEDGSVIYRNPARIQIPIIRRTSLQRAINYITMRFLSSPIIFPIDKNPDYNLQHDNASIEAFMQSVNTTKEIFLMIRNETDAKIFSFDICKHGLNSTGYYDAIASQAGFEVIQGVDEAIWNASRTETVTAKDLHWNPKGSEIAGNIIKNRISEYIDEIKTD